MPTHLHRHLIGPYWPLPPSPDEGFLVQQVQLSRQARHTLMQQLSATGAQQVGQLFGHYDGDTAHVTAILASCYPSVNAAAYALGALDTLRQAAPETQWLGTCSTAPDTRPVVLDKLLADFAYGQQYGLFVEQRILLNAGKREGELVLTALRSLDIDTYPEVIPVITAR